MDVVAYLYFKTPETSEASTLFLAVLASGITLTHFGKNDPPKRWTGDFDAMCAQVLGQPEQNKWAFLRDKNSRVGYFSHAELRPPLVMVNHVAQRNRRGDG